MELITLTKANGLEVLSGSFAGDGSKATDDAVEPVFRCQEANCLTTTGDTNSTASAGSHSVRYSADGRFLGVITTGGDLRIYKRGSHSGVSSSKTSKASGSDSYITIPSQADTAGLKGGIKYFYFSPQSTYIVTFEVHQKSVNVENVRCFNLAEIIENAGDSTIYSLLIFPFLLEL